MSCPLHLIGKTTAAKEALVKLLKNTPKSPKTIQLGIQKCAQAVIQITNVCHERGHISIKEYSEKSIKKVNFNTEEFHQVFRDPAVPSFHNSKSNQSLSIPFDEAPKSTHEALNNLAEVMEGNSEDIGNAICDVAGGIEGNDPPGNKFIALLNFLGGLLTAVRKFTNTDFLKKISAAIYSSCKRRDLFEWIEISLNLFSVIFLASATMLCISKPFYDILSTKNILRLCGAGLVVGGIVDCWANGDFGPWMMLGGIVLMVGAKFCLSTPQRLDKQVQEDQ